MVRCCAADAAAPRRRQSWGPRRSRLDGVRRLRPCAQRLELQRVTLRGEVVRGGWPFGHVDRCRLGAGVRCADVHRASGDPTTLLYVPCSGARGNVTTARAPAGIGSETAPSRCPRGGAPRLLGAPGGTPRLRGSRGGAPGATRPPGHRYLLLSRGGRVTPSAPPPSTSVRAPAVLSRAPVGRGSRGGWVTRRAASVHATPPRMV